MKEQSILGATESRPAWESLETFARQGIQRLLQQLLEEEVEQVLGRARYERRDGMDATPGYRNGFGKPRRLSAMAGTITVRRPRVRGLEARFVKRRTEQVGRLLPAGCQAEYEMWKRRRLDDLEPVYVWADAIYVKAGLEKDKAAMLVVIAALRDGRKIVLAVESGYRESTESWAALLRDLKARGLRAPRLLIADGHLGIWGAVGSVFPTVREQRCWNHHLVNVLDTLPKTLQGRGPGVAHEDPLRGHAGGGGAAQAGVSGVGHEEGRGPGEPPARGGLGAVGDLLRLPEGALETPA
jgi:putative transposase